MFLLRKSQIADHQGRQTMPYLPNETFSAKSTQYMSLKAYKKLYATSLWTRYVATSTVTDTQTPDRHIHTHEDHRNPHACAEA